MVEEEVQSLDVGVQRFAGGENQVGVHDWLPCVPCWLYVAPVQLIPVGDRSPPPRDTSSMSILIVAFGHDHDEASVLCFSQGPTQPDFRRASDTVEYYRPIAAELRSGQSEQDRPPHRAMSRRLHGVESFLNLGKGTQATHGPVVSQDRGSNPKADRVGDGGLAGGLQPGYEDDQPLGCTVHGPILTHTSGRPRTCSLPRRQPRDKRIAADLDARGNPAISGAPLAGTLL
jgi:hypothetical protein